MGWTDDPDEEGLIEENPFVFIGLALAVIVAAGILHFIGISYDPGWFEGQNLISTMGVIFLIFGMTVIGVSTLTGHSDLVKWEALFLIIAVAMILIGNDFDFRGALETLAAEVSGLGSLKIADVMMAILLLVGIATAVAIGTGHRVGMGAAVLIVVLVAVMGVINMWNAGTFDGWGATVQEEGWAYALGKALSDFTGGLAAGHAGMAIGFGCLVIGFVLVIIPNFSTPIGVVLLIIGAGITGMTLWEDYGKDWFEAVKDGDFKAWAVAAGLIGGPVGVWWLVNFKLMTGSKFLR